MSPITSSILSVEHAHQALIDHQVRIIFVARARLIIDNLLFLRDSRTILILFDAYIFNLSSEALDHRNYIFLDFFREVEKGFICIYKL